MKHLPNLPYSAVSREKIKLYKASSLERLFAGDRSVLVNTPVFLQAGALPERKEFYEELFFLELLEKLESNSKNSNN